MNLPYNWDFIQDNIPLEKLAENWNAFNGQYQAGQTLQYVSGQQLA